MLSKSSRFVAMAGIVILVLTACGGKAGPQPASAGKSSAGKAKKGLVNVGVIAPFTGSESYIGPGVMTGVKAAIAAINAAGGVNGVKLSAFTADDAADPATAVPAYRKMLSVDNPSVVIGSFSWTNPALLPLVGSTKTPDFMLGGTTQLNNVSNAYFWRTQPSDDWQALAQAYYAISKGWKRGAFAYATTNSAQTLKNPTKAAFEAGGGQIIAANDIVPGAASYRSAITRLMAAKPDVIFFEMDPGTAGTFFRQAVQLGFQSQTQWIGTDTDYSADFFKAVGPKVATTNLVVTTGALQEGPPAQIFNQWNKQVNNLSQPGLSAPYGYDAVVVAALAMEAAKSTSGSVYNAKVKEVSGPPGVAVYDFAQGKKLLAQGKDINYEGVASSVDFDKTNNVVGPWGVYAFTPSGDFKTVATVSGESLSQFSKKR